MQTIHALVVAAIAVVLSGCAGVQEGPTSEQRMALAPTGKLRVGFLSTTPIHATKDAASGEFKGPAVDLGKEMARRIGVQFEPVPYTSFPPVLAGAKSGEWDIAMIGIVLSGNRSSTSPHPIWWSNSVTLCQAGLRYPRWRTSINRVFELECWKSPRPMLFCLEPYNVPHWFEPPQSLTCSNR